MPKWEERLKNKKMTESYQELKCLAQKIREKHNITSFRILRRQMKQICKSEGIQYIDQRPGLKKCNGAYFYTKEEGASILIKKGLPDDPFVFTLGHELKHHLTDRDKLVAFCTQNSTKEMEIGAEIFAAELLFPDHLFVDTCNYQGIQKKLCQPQDLVRLKRDTQTTLSYAGLVKKAEFLGYIPKGAFKGIQWKKLEESLYGLPFYKRR